MKQDPHRQREAEKYEHPIASREHILDCLAELGTPTSAKRLAKALGVEKSQDLAALAKRLGAMVRGGQLLEDRRHMFAIATRLELVTGKVSAHPDGFGFLLRDDDDDVFLSGRQMRQVIHGDTAQVRLRGKDRRGRTEGEIVEVVERNTRQLVGRYYIENSVELLEPLNTRINHEVIVKSSGSAPEPGQIVVAEITQQPSLHGVVIAEVVEILGDHLTPGIEVEVALRNHDIPFSWSDDTIAYADNVPNIVRAADKRNRFDLTELPLVTIDGEDARDFDDAVYCEAREGGGWRLYVAIADVDHYVRPGSVLDESAHERGTSVYFPQYVVPMLPEKLSNGICSLNPGVERLAMVCEMTISVQGKISSYVFYEGVIRSHARLTYTEVAKAISDDSPQNPVRTSLGDLALDLDELHNLYQSLLIQRQKRGAVEFESNELQFQFSDTGQVLGIELRSRNTAHRIIEECMLCANVCAARLTSSVELPGLFRVHEPPEAAKLEMLATFLNGFGIRFQYDEVVTPGDYQQVVRQLQGRPNGKVLQIALLRSMNQAVYQVQNKGHFGLGYAEYTHFTSPIRRYPDLLTHRLIKAVIHSKADSKHTLRLGKAEASRRFPYDSEQMSALGDRTSFTERRADAAVYEVLEHLKCDYISDRVGDIVGGVVTAVTKFGLFVEIEEVFVEGLVHVSTLIGDYYHFDQELQCLIGDRTQIVYGMGDAVEVQIARVDVQERKIDFELISHSPLTKRSTLGKTKSQSKSRSKSGSGSRSGAKRGRRGDRRQRRQQK